MSGAVAWEGRSLWDGAPSDPEHPGDLDDRGAGRPRAAAAGLAVPVVPTRVGPPPRRPAPQAAPGLAASPPLALHDPGDAAAQATLTAR